MNQENSVKFCRDTFEILYSRINDLTKDNEGNYKDWKLQLTWTCWQTAWETCYAYNNSL